MDCETRSPTLSGYFQRERKKFPLFFVKMFVILKRIVIFVDN